MCWSFSSRCCVQVMKSWEPLAIRLSSLKDQSVKSIRFLRLLDFSTSPAFALGWEIRKLVSSNAYFTMQISAWCAFFDIKMREMREMPEMREMQSMTFRTKEIAVREINSDARPSCRDDVFIITQLFQHMSLWQAMKKCLKTWRIAKNGGEPHTQTETRTAPQWVATLGNKFLMNETSKLCVCIYIYICIYVWYQ